MTVIRIQLDEDRIPFAPVVSASLQQLVDQIGWPDGATAATQGFDGEILYWDAPIEQVRQAREACQGRDSLMPRLGLGHQIHVEYTAGLTDMDPPVCACDWESAIAVMPQLTS